MSSVHPLDIKLLRDLLRIWAQALAIALVIAGGVATLILAVGSYRSLDETRAAYYERYRFADVFAVVSRAPKTVVDQILEIPGVAAAEARIAKLALLDIPNYLEPATAQVISLPDIGEPRTLEEMLHERAATRLLVFCDEEAEVKDPVAALAAGRRGTEGQASPLAVLIGPEGGFAAEERAALLKSPNTVRLALGPRILRADTAAVAALALVGAVLGDWR